VKVKMIYYESGDWETLLIDGRPVASDHTIDTDWLLKTLWDRLGLPPEDLEFEYNHHPTNEEHFNL